MLSPNEQVRVWLAKASPAQAKQLIEHLVQVEIRAAILAYQYVSDHPLAD
jgi:hypothetical protein